MPEASLLRVSADVRGQRARIALAGEVDTGTANQLETELSRIVDAGATMLELDLSHLDFIDSWGLRVLIATRVRLEEVDGQLQVVAAGDQTRRLLTITGLGAMLVDPAAGPQSHNDG